ncbi:MAG TPA: hypothetical protein VET65_05085 [Candidatus Limnocylindrales bacterium]|nr:hypothetical protein [Candidatus Limnocylindrales bacterium]
MYRLIRWTAVVAAATSALVASPALAAHADDGDGGGGGHAVFAQLNDPTGNAIAAFDRNRDGTLSRAGTYLTGGLGARAVGAPSDPLASQDSLVFDREHSLLFAVNAGSDTVSVFRVNGDRLRLRQVIASGGQFPASIAVSGDLVYVLDAGGAGNIQGYRIAADRLRAIPGSNRSLGLTNLNPPAFLMSPPEIRFTPDGGQLVVTTKFGGNSVDVFRIGEDGRPSAAPTVTPIAGGPFPVSFTPSGLLVLVTAGNSSVATYRIAEDGTLALVSGPVPDGQGAACWIAPARGFDFVANTASGDISAYRISEDGAVVLVNAMAATGLSGPVDEASAGKNLYVEAGGGSSSLEEFVVNASGSLTHIGSVPTGPNQEGLVVA